MEEIHNNVNRNGLLIRLMYFRIEKIRCLLTMLAMQKSLVILPKNFAKFEIK